MRLLGDTHVLLVEDNPADARLVHELLRESGGPHLRVTDVGKLADALELLAQQRFDVMLLDLALPDSNGLATLHAVQAAADRLPVVVLSGHSDEEIALQAVQAGAQDYLVKGQGDGNLLTRALCYAIERKRSEEKLTYLAQYDPVTALPNRALFRDRLEHALRHARRNGSRVAVMFLDLDHFKDVNDTLGHDAGDALLAAVGRRLQDCVREGDTVARLGGDEFTIILEQIKRPADAEGAAQKLLHAMARSYSLAGRELFITTSIGISIYPDHGTSADELIKNADTGLYCAKRGGRSNYMVFHASMNLEVAKRHALVNDLRHALERQEFSVYYQPLINPGSGNIVALEALLRWQHPQQGVILPEQFVAVLEDTGMIQQVGDWVLRECCRQLRAWMDDACQEIPVSVNLSVQQFRSKDLLAKVATLLSEFQLSAACLQFDITESVLAEEAGSAMAVLRALHAMGVRCSIDDFGTGYSSLRNLKQFPLYALKLDRSFIQRVPDDPDDAAIVKAVISLAHNLNLKVVAEGVESERQLAFLRAQHCDLIQGNLFSPPVIGDECNAWLRDADAPVFSLRYR